MFFLAQGALDEGGLFVRWSKLARARNFGAMSSFFGLVRGEGGESGRGEENDFGGLFFEAYEPLLRSWQEGWVARLGGERGGASGEAAGVSGGEGSGDRGGLAAVVGGNFGHAQIRTGGDLGGATGETAEGGILCFAHSLGEVGVGACSFGLAILSRHRRVGLDFLPLIIEDFKAAAPIWKYELRAGKKIYIKDRSTALPGAGILGIRC